jgi:hypothetical protein
MSQMRLQIDAFGRYVFHDAAKPRKVDCFLAGLHEV